MSKYAGKLITNQAPAGYSVFFDGSGDYLTVPAGSAFAPGTGNFTIEAWVYPTASGNRFIWTQTVSGTNYFVFAIDTTAYLTMTASGGGTGIIGPANSIKQNAWNHIAAVRVSGTVTVYVNGVGGTPTSNTLDLSNTTYTPTIGTYTHSTASDVFTGYMSNLRYVKGTALYTANFTPPTQLFNVTNTSLLTCNSPALIDQGTANSGSGFPITANGNAAVSTFTPFTAYVPYNPALGASTPGVWTLDEAMQAAATRQWNMYDPSFQNTTLLLHGNGTNGAQNNTFLDSSSNNFTITRNGNTTQGSFSPFSQTGWGNYLNGSTDYFRVSDNAAFDFGTGAFCIEMWFMLTADAAQNGETNREATLLAAFPDSGTLATTYAIGIGGNSATTGTAIAFSIRQSDTIAYNQTYTATITKNVWHHIAVCRSGNDFAMFYDGLRVSSNASYTYTVNTNHSVKIGALIYPTYNNYFPGYISNLRIVKGASVYAPTSLNIAVPTEPLGTTSGGQTPPTGTQTSLLTCQSNRFVDNSSNAFAITVNGTPSVQAFSPFYPTAAYTPATIGGSGYFDGSGDYLTIANNANLQVSGNVDMFVEAFIYLNTTGGKTVITKSGITGSSYPNWTLAINTSNKAAFVVSNSGSPGTLILNLAGATTLTIGQWYHLVGTKRYVGGGSVNEYRLFVNGVLDAFNTAANISDPRAANLSIGVEGSSTDYMNGYVQSLRFSNSNIPTSYQTTSTTVGATIFTPPTAPVTTTSQGASNVQLLLNFTNAGIYDGTMKNNLETVGNAQVSTSVVKYGTGSMYFDGTGDYLTVRSSPDLYLSTGPFTIEAWVYPNNTTTGTIVSRRSSANARGLYFTFGEFVASKFSFYAGDTNTVGWEVAISSANTYAINQWYHVAITRDIGNVFTLWVNGVSAGTATSSVVIADDTSPLLIGGIDNTGVLNGYIDDLRITKGVARYTQNFIPPSVALPRQ